MRSMALEKQMELFEDGGLKDEGGTTDLVSGNDVPPGSTQEEVRDDIPAQLSEGEFVVPADVVRYVGLENLMRMRQEAKQGLAQMEAMGQMGNSEEATVEDDLPFDMYDLDVEDEGSLNMQAGGMVPTYNPQTGTYTMPGTGMGGFQPAQQMSNTGFTPYTGIQPYIQPVQYTGTQYTTADQTTNIPTFGQMVGSGYQGQELRTYVNDAGQTLQIPFIDGKPVYPIPDGYNLVGDQPKKEEQPVTQLSGPTTTVTDQDSKDMPDVPTSTTSSTLSIENTFKSQNLGFPNSYDEFSKLGGISNNKFGGTDLALSSSAYRNAVASLGGNQLGSMSPTGGLVSAVSGKLGFDETAAAFNFKDRSIAGNKARNAALSSIGMIDPAQVYSTSQLDFVGQVMNNAMTNQKSGLSVDESVNKALQGAIYDNFDTIKETVDEVSRAFATAQGIAETVPLADIDFKTAASIAKSKIGGLTDANGNDVGDLEARISKDDFDNLSPEQQSMYNSYTSSGDYTLTRRNRMTQDLINRQKQNIDNFVKARDIVDAGKTEEGRLASTDFTGTEADPGGALEGVDRGDGRDATFGGPGSDMAPGGKDTAKEREDAEKQSAEMGIFGP